MALSKLNQLDNLQMKDAIILRDNCCPYDYNSRIVMPTRRRKRCQRENARLTSRVGIRYDHKLLNAGLTVHTVD